jgi:serine/threonine protein kinase
MLCNVLHKLSLRARMALTSGTKLGPYEILSSLGAGGMGEVYRAKDTRPDRTVAIKVLPGTLAKDADRLRRFEQEARTIAALNHPNILGIHDIGTHEGAPFLVSELPTYAFTPTSRKTSSTTVQFFQTAR